MTRYILPRTFLRTKYVLLTLYFYLMVLSLPSGQHLVQAIDGGSACSNSSDQYLNESLNECMPCTKCPDTGLDTYANCTAIADSICYLQCSANHYYNNVTGECTSCSSCSLSVSVQCTPISDAVCLECTQTESYNSSTGTCVTDCSKCADGCVPDHSQPPRCACLANEFFDNVTEKCSPCTVCSDEDDLFTLVECSATKDAVCHELCPDNQYYDTDSMSCTKCTECSPVSSLKSVCSASSDTQCCHPKKFYNRAVGECTPDCDLCPLNTCESVDQCSCPTCFTGPLCDVRLPRCQTTDPVPKPSDLPPRPTESDDVSITPVTSALIALGAVIGIILFSALFVLLGVASSCHRGAATQTDSSSNNSIERFLEDSKASASLINMYKQNPTVYNEYRASIDMLRLSPGSAHSLSSSASSNNTSRDSPKSTRLHSKHRDKNWAPV